MELSDIKQRILETELDYPCYLTSWQDTDFGRLFWNEDERENPDLNHAVLYPGKDRDFTRILSEITRFYCEKGIQPRILQPYTSGYFMERANDFRINGYDIQIFAPTEFMLLTGENSIPPAGTLKIRELHHWDERIARDILIPDGNAYAIGQVRSCIGHERFRVLAGFLDGRAVSMVTVFYGDHGVARLSSAETTEELRGRGYARELISAIVDMHRRESGQPLYLWPKNVTAARIFRQAGFSDLFQEELAGAVYNRKPEKVEEA